MLHPRGGQPDERDGSNSPAPRAAPGEGDCEGILAWHSCEGHYGDVRLDGLNVVALGYFEGNIWAGDTKATRGIYMDERADERQREALTPSGAAREVAGR
jgi:hypothetical protein